MTESDSSDLHVPTSTSTSTKLVEEYKISEEPWYNKNLLKWASYDLGNTIFSMVVVSLVFLPMLQVLYFDVGYSGEAAINRGNAAFSLVLLLGNLTMAFISPFLGAFADQMKHRKGLLMGLSMLCITFMAALGVSRYTDSIILILAIFFFSNLFYQMALIVYDATLPFVTDREKIGKVSGIGVALGYFGSFIGIGLAFALIPIYGDIETTPINEESGVLVDTFSLGYAPYIFPIAAFLFLLFAIPMFTLREKDREMLPKESDQIIKEVTSNAVKTGKEIIGYRSMLLFLIGWLIFIDGANTVIAFMTPMVTIGLEFGRTGPVLIVLGIGIASAVVLTYPVGLFVDKNGPKKGMVLITFLWMLSLTIAFFTNLSINGTRTPTWLVYIFPIFVGPALGGSWVVQRQFISELAPPAKVANYFGFSNIFGRISAALSPFIFTYGVYLLNQIIGLNINLATRYAIFILGFMILLGFMIIMIGVEDIHDVYINGGRATGEGTWVDKDGNVIYDSRTGERTNFLQ